MFTVILLIVIVLLVLLLASMTGLNLKNVQLAEFWSQQYVKSESEYAALEQGRDEESEAYEQQYLSFLETIQNQSNAIDSYIEDLHFLVKLGEKHFEHCLPDLGDEDRAKFEGIRQSVLLQG